MLVTTAAFGILGAGLLAGGSVSHSIVLLAWGGTSALVSVGTGCLLGARLMIDDAVRSCNEHASAAVNETAVKVAESVAACLRETESDRDDAGTVRLYS